MFHLFLEKQIIPAFESNTLEGVLSDYFNYYAPESYEPTIEKIESYDEGGIIVKIILCKEIYNNLVDSIREYREISEKESGSILLNNWRF